MAERHAPEPRKVAVQPQGIIPPRKRSEWGPEAVRLTSIKLSGFKSFAEPTNFQVPGQLVGVVGPNGCGKSNIMDAVRWVLGESKASELRGVSLLFVFFFGSGSRKLFGCVCVVFVFFFV